MENYQWEAITQFIFPEEVGSIDEVISVNVHPKWQQEETEQSLRLVGIYHIQSVIRFNSKQLPNYSEGILIEHLEFDGDNGYFEYAYPLEVDLPKELVGKGNPKLEVSNVQFFVLDGSCCTFRWDVQCIIETEESINLEKNEQSYHNIIESSSKTFHQTSQLPEHIEEIQYEVNLESIVEKDEIEDTNNEQDEKNLLFSNNLTTVNRQQSINEQPIEQNNFQQNVIREIELETKNELEQRENQFIHEGHIANIRHFQPSDLLQTNEQPSIPKKEEMYEQPSIIINKETKQLEKQSNDEQSDDFLDSLKEDYTVFNVSNKIFRE